MSPTLLKTLPWAAFRSPVSAAAATGVLAFLFLVGGLAQTESAIANGDTRTVYLYHTHTHESIAATFRVNGQYDPATLHQLNHFLRDWRNDDETNMDPKLFDVIWETYRESGSTQPIQVVSAYRSPTTNALLRRRSKAVAEHSQHMLGKAMDMHYADVSMAKVREIALRLERGGVGYYPTSGVPFVHLDVGNVRYWPRMSYDALARLFPDGKAVFLAADGRPLPRYQEARAEIEARGNEPVPSVASAQPKSFFAMLFGGGSQDQAAAPAPQPRASTASFERRPRVEPAASVHPVIATVATDKQKRAEVRVASLDGRAGSGDLVWQAGAPGQPSAETLANLQAVPLPPHRPIELAALTADSATIPLPPARPAPVAALAGAAPAASGVTPLLRAANVPTVIIQGSSKTPVVPSAAGAALAYAAPLTAATATPEIRAARLAASLRPAAITPTVGLRAAILQKPIEFVAARLDPSNFSALLTPIPMARTTSESELGATVGALRSATRFNVAQLVFGPPSPVTAHFGSVVSDLRTSYFTGPAVRPLGLLFSKSDSAPADATESHRFD